MMASSAAALLWSAPTKTASKFIQTRSPRDFLTSLSGCQVTRPDMTGPSMAGWETVTQSVSRAGPSRSPYKQPLCRGKSSVWSQPGSGQKYYQAESLLGWIGLISVNDPVMTMKIQTVSTEQYNNIIFITYNILTTIKCINSRHSQTKVL